MSGNKVLAFGLVPFNPTIHRGIIIPGFLRWCDTDFIRPHVIEAIRAAMKASHARRERNEERDRAGKFAQQTLGFPFGPFWARR